MSAIVPAKKMFSVKEYEELIVSGFFVGKKRVELIEGELIEKMTQGDSHIGCINRLNVLFTPAVVGKAIVSVQKAMIVNPYSAPEPDVAILRFRDDFYSTGKARPEDVLLIIEVSDSTVRYDRQTKMLLYARRGIEEAWLVNLPRKISEVYRSPRKGNTRLCKNSDAMTQSRRSHFPK